MHPVKFINEVNFINEVGGDISKPVKDYLKDIHPTQMIFAKIETFMYEVEITYISESGRYVEGKRYVLLQPHDDLWVQIQFMIEDWAEKTNRESGYQKISNLKVIDYKEVAKAVLKID